ncbi:hypothetical protein [Achromobacter sp. K91]|uniref:hypothetical protein n=1 Tax=Achromobacter sp. K91 TaxID=2292262 RepID=UPI0011C496C9|nr:hypothetical protein [Achromobacter sp. K91]
MVSLKRWAMTVLSSPLALSRIMRSLFFKAAGGERPHANGRNWPAKFGEAHQSCVLDDMLISGSAALNDQAPR